MDHYEVLGTKYVPVRVATSDLADFCSKYTVVENGGQLVGGYSEKNLTAYTLTAAVDQNTNAAMATPSLLHTPAPVPAWQKPLRKLPRALP